MTMNDPIEQYLNARGTGWCTKYVLIAVIEDQDSDQSFFIQVHHDQSAAETVGLCESVAHIQKTKIAEAWLKQEKHLDDEE